MSEFGHLTKWEPPMTRFQLQAEKSDDGCWIWRGTCNEAGYGQIGVFGRTVYAHRFAYEAFVGHIPEGAVIDHRCNTPSCVNPDHLEAVEQAVNVRRGRLARLDAKEARKIRRASGTQREIARRHGVSQALVSMIKGGQRWAGA